MIMRGRHVGLCFHIDTNRINARRQLDNMNKLEIWNTNDVISLGKSETVLEEASAGSSVERTEKARNGLISITYADTLEERQLILDIGMLLFPNGLTNNNQKNDVEIVFTANKYCCPLITSDGGSNSQPGGILGNARRLKNELRIDVMNDKRAVALVKNSIKNRDASCRNVSKKTGEPLPSWVGIDYTALSNNQKPRGQFILIELIKIPAPIICFNLREQMIWAENKRVIKKLKKNQH